MILFQFLISKTFFKQIVIAVLGGIVVLFLLKFWLEYTTNHNQKIQVPNLQKMSLTEVQKTLTALNLDFIVIDSARFNPKLPKKSVIEQNPEAGDFVKEKRKIYITLNPSKFRDITIPNLNGQTKRQAITQLRSVGFAVEKTFELIPDAGKDVVRGLKHNGKKIQPNKKLPLNSKVKLILGDGKGN